MAGQRHIEGAYRLKDDTYRNYVPSIMWDYWVCGSQTVWKPLYTAVSKRVCDKRPPPTRHPRGCGDLSAAYSTEPEVALRLD